MQMRRMALEPAAAGAALWTAAPFAPASPLGWGSIEHGFLFFPLVAAPLAMRLLASLASSTADGSGDPYRLARLTHPVAAVMVLGSFLVPTGPLAGALTLGWLVTALLLAGGGLRWAWSQRPRLNLVAAHVFLPVAAVWLLLSRLGTGPRHFTALTVLLAALHFHYSGFALQILVAATGRRLREASDATRMAFRILSIGAVAGIVLIAAGNMASMPALKFAGVGTMVASTIALAITSASTARSLQSVLARKLILVSSLSLAAAMVVAGVYGVGELTGTRSIGIPRMVVIHGLLNALGFFLCGLMGHLVEERASRPHDNNAKEARDSRTSSPSRDLADGLLERHQKLTPHESAEHNS